MRWIWIDKFLEFEVGKRAVAVKSVTLAEDHLHDHFPGYPVMPASLLIEGMAQTGGILVGQARGFRKKVVLAKISKAVFYDLVLPGMQIHLEAVIENLAEEGASIRGTIRTGDKVIAEMALMYSHIDKNMGGIEFPEENFVFNERFMNLFKHYLPDDTGAC